MQLRATPQSNSQPTTQKRVQKQLGAFSQRSNAGTKSHKKHTEGQILPAGTPCACRRRAGCRCLPTGLGWLAGSLKKLRSPPCPAPRWPRGCRRPSPCRRCSGWQGLPKGCGVSLWHPRGLAHLHDKEEHCEQSFSASTVSEPTEVNNALALHKAQ